MPITTGSPNIVNATQSVILRAAGYHGTDNGILPGGIPPGYTHRAPDGAGGFSLSTERAGMRLLRFELLNAAAAAPGGIGFRFDPRFMKVGRLSADGATYTDLSAAVIARTASTVQVTGADQTGFVVGYPEPFGWVSTDITTAETNAGGATVADHAVQYSQNGTTWVTTTAGSSFTDNFTLTDTVWAAGATNFVWAPASDWRPNTTLIGGTLAGYYLLRFTSAHREASDVAAIITGLELGILEKVTSIAQNGIYENEQTTFSSHRADAIVAYFGTANAGNSVYCEWETW